MPGLVFQQKVVVVMFRLIRQMAILELMLLSAVLLMNWPRLSRILTEMVGFTAMEPTLLKMETNVHGISLAKLMERITTLLLVIANT